MTGQKNAFVAAGRAQTNPRITIEIARLNQRGTGLAFFDTPAGNVEIAILGRKALRKGPKPVGVGDVLSAKLIYANSNRTPKAVKLATLVP